MSEIAVEELARLRAFATRRLANPNGEQLCRHLDAGGWAIGDAPLAPWEMSLGFHTPYWATLAEEQRLALNHWTYVMMYFRIGDGERFVVLVNEAISGFLAQDEPQLSGLMRRCVAMERTPRLRPLPWPRAGRLPVACWQEAQGQRSTARAMWAPHRLQLRESRSRPATRTQNS